MLKLTLEGFGVITDELVQPITTTEYPYTEVQHLFRQTVTSFTQPISVLAVGSLVDWLC